MPRKSKRKNRRKTSNSPSEMKLRSINQIVNVRLSTLLTVAPASNVLAGFIPADPSAAGLNILEYSAWQGLFAQVRLIGMTVNFIPRSVVGSGGDTGPLAIASTLGVLGSPTSEGVVLDNADGILWNWIRTTSNRGIQRKMHITTQPTWADVTTPAPGDNVGCPGGFIYYGSNQPAGGQGDFTFQVDVYVQFRSRA